MSDPVVTAFLTKLICEHGGALQRAKLGQLLDLPQERIDEILNAEPKRFPQYWDLVLARSPVRLCPKYMNGKEEEDADCDMLHLCSFYIQGKLWLCKKKQCKNSHNTKSEHNLAVLKANDLSGLNDQELNILLLQNDPFILPGTCNKYNHNENCDQDGCHYLHICGYFIRGTCNRQPCNKCHNLLKSGSDILLKRYSETPIKNFQMILDIQHNERMQELTSNGNTRRGRRGRGRFRGAASRARGRSRGSSTQTRSSSRISSSGVDSDDEVQSSTAELSLSLDKLDQDKGSSPVYSAPSPIQRATKKAGNLSSTADPGSTHCALDKRPSRTSKFNSGISSSVTVSYTSNLQEKVFTSPAAQPASTVRANGTAVSSSSAQQTSTGISKTIGISTTPVSVSKSVSTTQPPTPARRNIPSNIFKEDSFKPVQDIIPNNVSTACPPTAEKNTVTFGISKKAPTAGPSITQPPTPARRYIPSNMFDEVSVKPVQDTIPNNVSTACPPTAEKNTVTFGISKKAPTAGPSITQPPTSARRYIPSNMFDEVSVKPVQDTIPNNVSTACPPTAAKNTVTFGISKKAPTAGPSITQPPTPARRYIPSNMFDEVSVKPVQDAIPNNVSTASPPSKEKTSPIVVASAATPPFSENIQKIVGRLSGPDPLQSSRYNLPDTYSSLRSEVNSAKKEEAKAKVSTEICVFNIWKQCKFGSRCTEMHFHLPYRWQMLKASEWQDMADMELIEKAYCDPKNSRTSSVDFGGMRSGPYYVRRLSTPSSVLKPADFVLTTEWLWYWMDEYGAWIQYGKSNTKQVSASITSSDLESIYLSDPNETVYFRAGQQDYEIDFQNMKQKNIVYKTEKDICRRPKFLSYNDVVKLKGSTKSVATSPSTMHTGDTKTSIYPSNWDTTALPDVGYKLVNVPLTSTEGLQIKSLFMKTVKGHEVKKISRIQNPSLWQVYHLKKEQMKKENRGVDADERKLFHGTSSAHLTAICHHNFDWRICGVHGTVYGQGSYFARDASYSHNYSPADHSGKRSMFVARVLVGQYVKGGPTLRRPPSKHGSLTQFYDSCVDDVLHPSIFVVFEKHQIYPEYLLEYEEEKKSCSIS